MQNTDETRSVRHGNEHKLYSKEKVDCQKLALSFYRVHVRIFQNGLNKAYSGRSWAPFEINAVLNIPFVHSLTNPERISIFRMTE